MRVLWTHNFDAQRLGAQAFMNTAAEGVRSRGLHLEVEYLGNLRSVRRLWMARKRIRLLSTDFDLVHAQYGSACSLATAGVAGIPKVLSIRGNDWSVHQGNGGFHYVHTRLARGMTRLSIGAYDCVLPVSQRMATELRRVAPGARVDALPTPIDLGRFVPRDKAQLRADLGFPGCSEKWILFNAVRLDDPIKRFRLAQRAFDLANGRRGDLRLRIATDLPHATVPAFTAACDLILCTSETEGWPNSVKEALACNVPFVSTDVSDLREIAKVEPSCRICSPDPVALADGICEALSITGASDLRRHVMTMSVDAVTERLVEIYHELLSIHRCAS